MTKDKIQEYTRRISEANKTEIIVIVYEMANDYFEDAYNAISLKDYDAYKMSCDRIIRCADHLLKSLDMKYEIAGNLRSIYEYVIKEVGIASVKREPEILKALQSFMKKLHGSFIELSKQDESAVLMQNAQTVYAGLTYGKNSLNESMNSVSNRGFIV